MDRLATDEPPSSDLAMLARGGDTDAYRMLVQRYQDVAFRTAYLVTGSASDAEDAVQDGFVKAHTGLERFDPRLPFRPWLLTIVANEARNRRRSEGRRLSYEAQAARQAVREAATVASPEVAAVLGEEARTLVAAVNALPSDEHLIVGLRYFLELSEAETASVAGIPAGTVKSRLSRALRRLRESLGESDDRS